MPDDLPDQRPHQPRPDPAAADLGTMVERGLAVEPSIAPFLEPQWPPEAEPEPYDAA